MHRRRIVLGVALVACDPEVYSENGGLRFVAPLLQSRTSFTSGDRVLAGSRICMTLDGYRPSEPHGDEAAFASASDDDLHACYEPRIVGSATIDGDGCIALAQPGSASWELSRRDCPVDLPPADDRIAFDVVAIDEVVGAFRESLPFGDFQREDLVDSGIELVVPGLDAPGVVPALHEPLYVLEGPDSVAAVVAAGAPLSTVAVSDASTAAVARAGAPTFDAPPEPGTDLSFTARAGDVFDAVLQVPGGALEVGEVRIVAASAIVALELYPSIARLADADVFYGLGASVYARDAEAHVIRGVEASWRSLSGDGELEILDVDGDGVADPSASAFILDECVGARRGEARSALLEARLGDLVETVEVEWTCVEGHVDDGCGCRSSSRASPLALLGLCAYRRRRQRT